MAFNYKSEPMGHQVRALKRAWPKHAFGLFHAMGAGKTFTTINLAAARFLANQLVGVVVVCPTAIKSVWAKEMVKWAPCEATTYVMESGGNTAARNWAIKSAGTGKMMVLCVGIEAMSQGTAVDVVDSFINMCGGEVMFVIDESSRIKTPSATRTKACQKMGAKCKFRIIMTGTPVSQGLHDLYSQIQFLDPAILNCKSYFLFKNKYCVMGGFENRKIIGYQFVDDLMNKIAPWVDVVTKLEALPDLPPKTYQEISVPVTQHQKRAIDQLKEEMRAEMEGHQLTVSMAMERITRYQQILGGFFPYNDEDSLSYLIKPIEGKNPKIEALLDLLDDTDDEVKFIIWARFKPELLAIADALRAKYGENSVREFHGGISADDRSRATDEFEAKGGPRFMVANPQVGGMGQTWVAATVEVYFSNSFSYEERVQSEDRAHRKGQEKPVLIVDLVSDHAADKMIQKALKAKGDLAKYVEENLGEAGEL